MTRPLPAFLITLAAATAAAPAQTLTWWSKSFDEALAAAKDVPSGMVLLYCWQDNHETCSAMYSGTMMEERAQKALADFVCMGVKNDDAGKDIWQRYKIQSVPTVLFLTPDGAVADVIVGYATIEDLLADLKRIRSGEGTIPTLQQAVDGGDKDLQKMQRLMQKLLQISQPQRATKVIDAMIEIDPRCKSEEAAEAMLWKITQETFRDDVPPQDVDLTELRRFLKTVRNKRVKFLGYDRMAQALWAKGEVKEAASYSDKAWKSIPDDQVIEWGQRMCGFVYRNWKDLEKVNKAILKDALKVSKATMKAIEERHEKQPDNTFLGNAMGLHAAILIINKKRSDALDLMEEAIKIDPKNENLKAWRDNWLKGNK